MFLQIWTPSCAETFAYARISSYLHPDARPMAAQRSKPNNNSAELSTVHYGFTVNETTLASSEPSLEIAQTLWGPTANCNAWFSLTVPT